MAIDEGTPTKGRVRKLAAPKKSVGDHVGKEVIAKWLAREVAAKKVGPVVAMIEAALAGFVR